MHTWPAVAIKQPLKRQLQLQLQVQLKLQLQLQYSYRKYARKPRSGRALMYCSLGLGCKGFTVTLVVGVVLRHQSVGLRTGKRLTFSPLGHW